MITCLGRLSNDHTSIRRATLIIQDINWIRNHQVPILQMIILISQEIIIYSTISIDFMLEEYNQDNRITRKERSEAKKEKSGRWTTAESYLFQSLLERYGKNWKKIYEHMKGRTLNQIRSHAQKYFDKVGPKKVQEFQRRAKLLDAYETLQNQKRLRETSSTISQKPKEAQQVAVKVEEEFPPTDSQVTPPIVSQNLMPLLSQQQELIKEQINTAIQPTLQYYTVLPQYQNMNIPYYNGGYLMNIIYSDPVGFQRFGIQNFVDNQQFRQHMQNQRQ